MVKHKSNRNKYLLITVLLLLVIVTVTAVAVMRTDSKKPSASEYFIVLSAHANEGSFLTWPNGTIRDNTYVTLKLLDLNVTAVGGDAHNVYVRCSSQANPVDDTVKVLTNGTSTKAGAWPIQLVGGDNDFHGISLDLNDNGTFEVDIQIACDEATLATIPVFISPKDIFNVPGGVVS
jgi:hypothetical protein